MKTTEQIAGLGTNDKWYKEKDPSYLKQKSTTQWLKKR